MINLEEVASKVDMIARTSSTLDKEYLLVEGANIEGFKDVLRFIYNPYMRTGIGKRKLDEAYTVVGDVTVEQFLEHFSTTRTGNMYDVELAASFVGCQETEEAMWLAQGMATKDLQIGVAVTTLNKVYGKGFIPIVGIMRGQHADQSLHGIYIATEKIDGNRRLIMNKPSGPEIYTRSGRRDAGLIDLEEQASCLPTGYVYDTELAAVGDYADSIALRQATASIANSKGRRTGAKALVFDMIKQEDYDAGISRLGALGRKTMLAAVFGDNTSVEMLHRYFAEHDEKNEGRTHLANSVNALSHALMQATYTPNIMPLPILGIVHHWQEALNLAQPIWDTGGEGLMLAEYKSAYEVNPNPRSTLLKIKATKEFTLRCTNVYAGEAGKKYENSLGGIYVDYEAQNGKVYTVGCGSGFADYQRDMFWDHPSKIVGKLVEIESFGESVNAAGQISLNCPIFKRVVGEE